MRPKFFLKPYMWSLVVCALCLGYTYVTHRFDLTHTKDLCWSLEGNTVYLNRSMVKYTFYLVGVLVHQTLSTVADGGSSGSQVKCVCVCVCVSQLEIISTMLGIAPTASCICKPCLLSRHCGFFQALCFTKVYFCPVQDFCRETAAGI